MNLARLFQRLALYRASRGVPLWVLVVLALGFWLLGNIGQAHAQTYTCTGSYQYPTESHSAFCGQQWVNNYNVANAATHEAKFIIRRLSNAHSSYTKSKTSSTWGLTANWTWTTSCPTGTQPNPANNYVCEDPNDQCRALNNQPGFIGVGPTARSFVNRCMANGCNFGIRPGTPYTSTNSGTSTAVHHGQYEWTGACTPPINDPPPPPDPEPKQECSVAGTMGDGTQIKQCVQKDGRICITMPKSGKQACWTPGQTGEQASGPNLQLREGGDKTANPTPPSIPEVTPQPPSIKTTTTNSGTGHTIITTTTNYITNNGTDAGPDTGVPDTGAPDGGEEGADKGSVNDDGECNSPPQVQGGDPLLANIIYQTWGTRCALGGVKSTGDITDCAQTFTIDGPAGDPNVDKLKASRFAICGDETGQEGGADGTYGIGDESGVEGGLRDGLIDAPQEFGTDGLNTAGYGWTRACPALPTVQVFDTTIDFNRPFICDWMQLGGWFVMLIGSIVALRIIGGAV